MFVPAYTTSYESVASERMSEVVNPLFVGYQFSPESVDRYTPICEAAKRYPLLVEQKSYIDMGALLCADAIHVEPPLVDVLK